MIDISTDGDERGLLSGQELSANYVKAYVVIWQYLYALHLINLWFGSYPGSNPLSSPPYRIFSIQLWSRKCSMQLSNFTLRSHLPPNHGGRLYLRRLLVF